MTTILIYIGLVLWVLFSAYGAYRYARKRKERARALRARTRFYREDGDLVIKLDRRHVKNHADRLAIYRANFPATKFQKGT
jgi:hypothetical protein